MAPKPNQMQLEKQKNAEIQRTQQAAEQSQNMQQPVQQNAQTQQNAQQFWTEEMALKEQIPMQSENLSEEMKSAYENAHGQRMGVKSRIWRTERTTKKKREKSNALRAADARYAHNRQILEKKYAMEEPLKDVDAPFQSAVKTWLDLSGTESADASNQTMLKRLNGKRDDQNKAITSIKNKIDGWKLQDYQNLDDQQITDRYYDLKDKIEKAKAYKVIYEYGISIGKSCSAGYEAKVLAKVEYFIRLEPYIQAKYDLITSPYYSLLRKEDLDALSDEQLKQRVDQAGGNMQSFYDTVSKLREMRKDARALMADPAAFEVEETKQQLQEAMRKEEKANEERVRFDEENHAREVKQYEEELKVRHAEDQTNLKRAKALEHRRSRQIRAKQIEQESKDISHFWWTCAAEAVSRDFATEKRTHRAVVTPDHTEEEIKQHYRNMASDDLNVRFKEYDRVFNYMLTIDLSRFKLATDDELLGDQAAENLRLLVSFFETKGLMDMALSEGMKIPKERQQEIWTRYSFFTDIHGIYTQRLNAIANSEYGEMLDEEEPKDFEEAYELSQKERESLMIKGKPEQARRYSDLMSEIAVMFNRMQELGMKDRSVNLEELWEEYKKNEERKEELASRKKLIEPAKKAKADWEAKLKKRNEVSGQVPEFKNAKYNDRRYRCLVSPLMPEEEMKQHFRNLASTDEKVRFREYEDAIERMMTFDLSQLEIRTDEQILEHAVENQLLFNQFSQITDLAKAAIAQGMEIPQERRQAIWKRYCFLLDLKALIDSRLTIMQWNEYGECTAGEEPKTREEALDMLAMAQKTLNTDKINFYAGISAGFVAGKKALNRKKTVQELWDSYQAPEMDEELKASKPA